VTSLAALMLADRGELDVDAPVARDWSQFAANGKQGVLVRHLLSHASGSPGWSSQPPSRTLYDWEKSISRYAVQAPWWEPGGRHCGARRAAARTSRPTRRRPGRPTCSGLPPAFIDVGSAETFRDEAVTYVSRIWQAGGVAELHV
jgi:acetyl esterase/lipase